MGALWGTGRLLEDLLSGCFEESMEMSQAPRQGAEMALSWCLLKGATSAPSMQPLLAREEEGRFRGSECTNGCALAASFLATQHSPHLHPWLENSAFFWKSGCHSEGPNKGISPQRTITTTTVSAVTAGAWVHRSVVLSVSDTFSKTPPSRSLLWLQRNNSSV